MAREGGRSWDPNGNLSSVTDANTHPTSFTYDNMDRVATRKDPLLVQESYQYDLNGNLTQFTDRRLVYLWLFLSSLAIERWLRVLPFQSITH